MCQLEVFGVQDGRRSLVANGQQTLIRVNRPGAVSPQPLPSWVTWQQRPFPDANLLLLHGSRPALVDGDVGHAEDAATWALAHAGDVGLVVNTHWHADHVGGNALLQAGGAGIAAGAPEADAVSHRDPGCCAAEYLDQPVVRTASTWRSTTVRSSASVKPTGKWSAPGHTPGHLALWQRKSGSSWSRTRCRTTTSAG